jgi:hypothetical protein
MLVDQQLVEAHCKRCTHNFYAGDKVCKLKHRPNKMDLQCVGPYEINCVHTNSIVAIA